MSDKDMAPAEPNNNLIMEECIMWDERDWTPDAVFVDVSIDENQFFLSWKIRHKQTEAVEISVIRDIRISQHAKVPKESKVLSLCAALHHEDEDLTDRCITFCTGTDFVNITWFNFVTTTTAFAKKIFEIVQFQRRQAHLRNPSHLILLKKLWSKISLEFKNPIKRTKLRKFFSENDCDSKKIKSAILSTGIKSKKINKTQFTFDYFLDFYQNLFFQEILEEIFQKIVHVVSRDSKQITGEEFAKFINEFQRDKRSDKNFTTVEEAKQIISKYEPNIKLSEQGIISSKGFVQFFLSDDNGIRDQSSYELTQDMTQPFNHYFINSSHNTYLTGNQILDKSSAEIYRQVLLSGCRCVELDIWDGNGNDDEPIVTHGKALCTNVELREVLGAINESAFKASDYPVILSFENHCTPKSLPLLASIVQEVLGDKVLVEPFETNPLKAGISLPSPEMLKGRFLIKMGKKSFEKKIEDANNDVKKLKNEKSLDGVPKISKMINYVQSTTFQSFEKADTKNVSYECCSFKESSAISSLEKCPSDFVNFNKRQISRIYPKGKRIYSSNYLPQLFWNAGCQLAALNFQTLDLGLQLNLGLFDQQNRCGYLLKPIEMRRKDQNFDPFLQSMLGDVSSTLITITVKSGQFISKQEGYCFVKSQMFGLPPDTVRKRDKIKSKTTTGLNPQFSNEPLKFTIRYPALAVLRLKVSTDDIKFVGQAWLPVRYLKPGYRLVNLKNESAETLMVPSILIYVEIAEIVPSNGNQFDVISETDKEEIRKQQLEIFQKNF